MVRKQVIKFLEGQTNEIRQIYKSITHSYWNATTTGNEKTYKQYEDSQKKLARFFNNSENFFKIKEFINLDIKDKTIKRQLTVLYNSYLDNQGDLSLIDKIVEKSTEIEKKFNLFRAKINGKNLTDNQIDEILKTETNSKKLQIAWEASKKQGEVIEKELIELVDLRNQLARHLGFKNYHILSLKTNEQTEKQINEIFKKLDDFSSSAYRMSKAEIDLFLSKKYKTSNLKPWHYQNLFFQEPPGMFSVNLDKFYKKDVLTIAEKFYESMGLDVSNIVQRSDLYERKGKYQHAYCMDLDKEGDIRSVMNIKNNEKWMGTILHEFGHGVYWKYINKKLPFLLKDCAHTFITEAIAQLLERNSKNLDFITKFCDINKKEIDNIGKDLEKSLKLEKLVFSKWSQVMFNFEKNLYDNPHQNLNKLWWELVKRYQLIDFSRNKPDWASKIHFVSYPVYYHNYLIGELFASQINNYVSRKILKKDSLKSVSYTDKKEVGDYLKSKIFFPGAFYSWNELIEYSTGEKLNPKYWIKEFC